MNHLRLIGEERTTDSHSESLSLSHQAKLPCVYYSDSEPLTQVDWLLVSYQGEHPIAERHPDSVAIARRWRVRPQLGLANRKEAVPVTELRQIRGRTTEIDVGPIPVFGLTLAEIGTVAAGIGELAIIHLSGLVGRHQEQVFAVTYIVAPFGMLDGRARTPENLFLGVVPIDPIRLSIFVIDQELVSAGRKRAFSIVVFFTWATQSHPRNVHGPAGSCRQIRLSRLRSSNVSKLAWPVASPGVHLTSRFGPGVVDRTAFG